MNNLIERYQLDQCLDWICENNFKKVALQLKLNDLKFSVDISEHLKEKFEERTRESLELYITQSSTCCVDLVVTQHVGNLDALIHFGNVCLSKQEIKNSTQNLPVLFAFGKLTESQDGLEENLKLVVSEIERIKRNEPDSKIFVFYDTFLIDLARRLRNCAGVDVAKVHCPYENWACLPEIQSMLVRNSETNNLFGYYVLENHIKYYSHAIYLGNNLSIDLALNCPRNLLHFKFHEKLAVLDKVEVSKLLNKRIALVSRLKAETDLKVGVLITNPLPDITESMKRLESYARPQKHTLYFISMIQTIDECKIGNFDLCDAFLVINSCTCSTILKSLFFNRPIITELEFKLACGFEAEYGQISWPGSSTHLSEDDMINKRKVSDVSVALIHTRNELLERCSQAKVNKWYGLEFGGDHSKATDGGDLANDVESLNIEEGLKGIASSYISEPLNK